MFVTVGFKNSFDVFHLFHFVLCFSDVSVSSIE